MAMRWWMLAVVAASVAPTSAQAQSEVVIEAPELRDRRDWNRDRDRDRDWSRDRDRDRDDDWRDGRRRARDDDWDEFNDDRRWRRRWDREVVYVGGAWDDLPPGWRKQIRRGRRWPPGWGGRARPVPVVIARRLPPVGWDYDRVWIDGRVITRDRRSGTIVDIGVIWRR